MIEIGDNVAADTAAVETFGFRSSRSTSRSGALPSRALDDHAAPPQTLDRELALDRRHGVAVGMTAAGEPHPERLDPVLERRRRGCCERTCSRKSSRPSGRSTRRASASAAAGSGIVQSDSAATTVSNDAGANGSSSARGLDELGRRRRRARGATQHVRVGIDADDRVRGLVVRQVQPGADAELEHAARRLARRADPLAPKAERVLHAHQRVVDRRDERMARHGDSTREKAEGAGVPAPSR